MSNSTVAKLIAGFSYKAVNRIYSEDHVMSVTRALTCGIAVLLFWPGIANGGDAENTQASYQGTKKKLASELKTGDSHRTAAALRALADDESIDAVRLVLFYGLRDTDEDVRLVALQSLLTRAQDRSTCRFLYRQLGEELRNNQRFGTAALLAVLVSSKLPEFQAMQVPPSDGMPVVIRNAVSVALPVAEELVRKHDVSAPTLLSAYADCLLFRQSLFFRRFILHAFITMHQPSSVEALIRILGSVPGEVRGDITRYLATLSGEKIGADADGWAKWWEEDKDSISFGESEKPSNTWAAAVNDKTPSYYGIPVYAQKAVFVLDTSDSMNEQGRLAMAKRELIQAINALPADSEFNIVVYNSTVAVCRPGLVAASPLAKQAAATFVSTLQATQFTATYDALQTAFQFDVEAIFFLTDGMPTAGKIGDPATILGLVTQANQARSISLYTIGLSPGPVGGQQETFLKQLAENNFGDFRRVDQ
jgi:hypothetical protein